MRRLIGIRTLLMLLVLMAVLPGVALVVPGYFADQRAEIVRARAELSSLAKLAVASEQQLIEGVQQILSAVASGPSVRRADLQPLCEQFLRNIVTASSDYANVGVLNLAGEVRCQSDPARVAFVASDRLYFQRALRTHAFSVGEYVVSRVDGRKLLSFGMPVFDDAGVLFAVAYAGVDLVKASRRLRDLDLAEHLRLDVTDSAGRLLVSSHAGERELGEVTADPGVLLAIRSKRLEPFEYTDELGAVWLREMSVIGRSGDEALYAVASARKASVVASSADRLQRQLALLGAVTLGGLLLAGLMFERQFAAPMSRLLDMMRRAALGVPPLEPTERPGSREFAHMEAGLAEMLRKLNRQQDLLLKTQQITRVGFFELDLKTGLYTASDTVYEILGRDPSLGAVSVGDYQAMIFPADRQRVSQERAKAIEGGKPLRLPYRIVRPDGEIRWIDGYGFMHRDAQGAPSTYSGAMQDITEQHRVQRLYAVQSKIGDAIIRATSAGELYRRACEIAVQDGQLCMAWVAQVESGGTRLVPLVSAGDEDRKTR